MSVKGSDIKMESKKREIKVWYINNGVKALNLSELPRCTAMTKPTGQKCKRAALKGRDLCGIHAGNYSPGAPKGNEYRKVHGFYSDKARTQREEIRRLIQSLDELLPTTK
jgi:hypothetical protein